MFQLFFSLIYLIGEIESAKILGVFPAPSISHQIVFRPLMQELAERGHDVTVITTDPAFPKGQAPQNLTEIDVHNVSYEVWNNFLEENGNEKDRIKFFDLIFHVMLRVFEEEVKSDEVQILLNLNKKFDLVFVESCIRPALIFSHVYNAPVIEFSSLSGMFLINELIGAAAHPLIYPDPLHRRIYNLTMWEKISEFYVHYASLYKFREHVHKENEMLRRMFGDNIPSLDDLTNNVQMLFLNANWLWDFNRPVPPNVLYLGGMHQKPEHELAQEWKSYLDSSKDGVIYVSFGTNVKPSMLPEDKLKIFLDVFSKLPYDVLWKWDKDELPGRPKNVKISKWLPQADFLRHPKVKLFVTQGGLQSTDEAITASVPLIGVPILGDQRLNTEHYVKFQIGKKLAIETLTADELMDSIQTVLQDRSYKDNIVKLRSFIHDQPQSPLERAVWWTEYVLRHKGAAHLRAPSSHLSWAKYYEIELVLLLLVVTILAVLGTVFTICFILSKTKSYVSGKVKMNLIELTM